ncbi:SUMF1/EgtB/PvdO family nonheme iron enzyme [bacterium]|nr:SUMF1/EgtB/PvdO family nonheme iron enzyme [candidate division CSSED10-310 bacterium]
MKRSVWFWVYVSVYLLSMVSLSIAATVHGNAYKDGQADHSGITLQIEPFQPIPTLSVTGFGLLILGFGFFLLRRFNRRMMIPMVVCLSVGLSCITFAALRDTTVTNSFGQYFFSNVDPGDYSLEASAPGYYPESIEPLTVEAGDNTVPDITLYLLPTATPLPAGFLVAADPIVGNMRYMPTGTFTQGSPLSEPCRETYECDETQFSHTLTRDLAVMETEITRQMWADLRAVRPSLPSDPSDTFYSPTMSHPVQNVTWYMPVLFANLLSIQNGFTPCYYRDASFMNAVDATNYINDDHFCNFNANGYRLPTEGEWEYFCRAGTTTAFSCNETNYNSGNCDSCIPGTHPVLELYCAFCANVPDPVSFYPAGSKWPNPWNLKDVHGNISEWCWDWYGIYPTGPETDYTGPAVGPGRLTKGGTLTYPGWERSAARMNVYPDSSNASLGFRLVRSAP